MGPTRRDATVDITRGLIVVLMALDHVRLFFTAAQFNPVDVEATTWGYFLARWVTHLCAPGFFFIAGAGAFLMEQSGWSRPALARFLLVRGLWLVAVEILVFGLAWSFNPGWFWFGVIWGLGAAFVGLALCLYLPKWLLLPLAVLAAFGLPALGGILPAGLAALLVWGGPVQLPGLGAHLVLYPVLPWAALMVAGYASAPLWIESGSPVPKRLWLGAALLLIAFVAMRVSGLGGGVPEPSASGRTLMSFLNVQKYPPSPQFSALMIGLLACFAALVAADSRLQYGRLLRPLRDIGRVPFFFYLVHIFLIHGLALLVALALGWPIEHLFWHGMGPNLEPPDGYGLRLPGVLAAWIAVVAALWPACRWFGELKQRRPDNYLLRLL